MSDGIAGRRHVVLGANGFIGSHLLQALVQRNADVVAVVRTADAAYALETSGHTVEVADVRSPDAMRRLLRPNDIVFQLAGRSGAAESIADPYGSLVDNCGPVLAVLEAAAHLHPRPRIVFTGSRLQYGRVSSVPVTEDAPLVPTSPYGLNKTMCEAYLDLYGRQYGIGYAVARLTNPYGASAVRARPYNVLDQIVARALSGETISVFGDGSQIRDYIHIDDAVTALLLLAEHTDDIIVNVGSGSGIAFRDAVEYIIAAAGGHIAFVPWPTDAAAVETGDFVASIDRIRRLGFTPQIDFRTGINRSIAYARERLASTRRSV
ncbi:MAG: NAD-dependent epimerase/dehydratase family protein [Candidatus Velthaea sp.]